MGTFQLTFWLCGSYVIPVTIICLHHKEWSHVESRAIMLLRTLCRLVTEDHWWKKYIVLAAWRRDHRWMILWCNSHYLSAWRCVSILKYMELLYNVVWRLISRECRLAWHLLALYFIFVEIENALSGEVVMVPVCIQHIVFNPVLHRLSWEEIVCILCD